MAIPPSQKSAVGIIGLGIIGAQVAHLLRDAGYEVPVWNRTPKEGLPFWKDTPAEVFEAAEVVQLFVAHPHAVDDVLDAVGDALTDRHIVIASATLGVEGTARAAKRVEARGARFLDAPFTGSKEAAGQGQLLYYVGGEPAVLEAVRPILEVSGKKGIVPLGEVGVAAEIKVLTNVLSAVTVEVLAEMIGVLKHRGIPPGLLQKALERHGVRSGIIDMKLPKMLAGDFDPHFSLKHMLKDVRFGLDLADGLELPATQAVAKAMEQGVEAGLGELDFSVVVERFS